MKLKINNTYAFLEEYESLTKRQLQVLDMISNGKSTTGMVWSMNISKHTVRDHHNPSSKN